MAFYSQGGKLVDQIFLTEYELIDRYVGCELWNWGYNQVGTLGTNETSHRSSPVQTIAGGTNWKQIERSNAKHSGIKLDGTLWLWGQGAHGALGNNLGSTQSSPVQTVAGGTNWKQITGGTNQTAAIKTDGTLWVWGHNITGELGTNNITSYSSPVQTIAGGTNWKLVEMAPTASASTSFTAAIKQDGTLWVWGFNTNGQLGTNDAAHRSSPVQTIAGGTNWKQVACGNNHMAAIKTDGTLWLWGSNAYGQVGLDKTVKSSPVQVLGGGTWKQVTCGNSFTAAIKTDGTLWLWGYNAWGTLGNGNQINISSPVQTIAGGTNWKQVDAGATNTAAIKTDGTLWTWGANNYGQLGANLDPVVLVAASSPIQTIVGGTSWKFVTTGPATLALKTVE